MKTFLTEKEVTDICEAGANVRDCTLLWLMWESGIRVSEAVSMRRDGLDLERGSAFIRRSKVKYLRLCPGCGKKSGHKNYFCHECGLSLKSIEPKPEAGGTLRRIIQIGPVTRGYLLKHLEALDRGAKTLWVFPSPRDFSRHLTNNGAGDIVRRAAEAAGLGGCIIDHPDFDTRHKVSPHRLRDAAAVREFRKSPTLEGIRVIASQLGHRNPETTFQHYIKLVASGELGGSGGPEYPRKYPARARLL